MTDTRPPTADAAPPDDHALAVEQARRAMRAAQPRDRATRLRFNYEELVGQPQAIQATLDTERDAIQALARPVAARADGRVYGIGCGDSWAVAQGVREPFELLLNQPCDAVQALEFTRFGARFISPADTVFGLSASGTTIETVDGLARARAAGALTIGVTNTPGSPFTRVPEHFLVARAQRRASFPTQASTAPMAALLALAAAVARVRAVRDAPVATVEGWLAALPALLERVIAAADPVAQSLAAAVVDQPVFVFVGAGPGLAAAMFGAAKIREGCEGQAYVIGVEEFHHYEFVHSGTPVFLVAPPDAAYSRAVDVARVTQARGGRIISLVAEEDEAIAALSAAVFRLPAMPPYLAALPYTVPLQLAAWHIASARLAAGRLAEHV